MKDIKSFPLVWPLGYKRTEDRLPSPFKMTADKARKDLLKEIKLLAGDESPIISSNVPIRKSDGQLYADVANDKLDDPGIAVYFMLEGEQVSLACDKWETPAENLRALGLTVNALRGLDRWGVSEMLKRTFTGFKQLPPSNLLEEATMWTILGLKEKPETKSLLDQAYKKMSRKVHPDVEGGSREEWDRLNNAYNQASKLF